MRAVCDNKTQHVRKTFGPTEKKAEMDWCYYVTLCNLNPQLF